MKLSGKIIKIVDNKFTNQNGEESRVKGVVLREVTNDQYPQEAYIEYWNRWADEFDFKEGQIIRTSFSFAVKEREYQGKTYYQCQLKGWRAEIV